MDVGLDCEYPDEAGVYITQLCYEILKICQSKYERFDYLLYLVNRNQSNHNTIHQLNTRWTHCLNKCPLIDVIVALLSPNSKIKVLLTLLGMLNSEYTMLNTAIFLINRITNDDFEESLYHEFLEVIVGMPILYVKWSEKLKTLHNEWRRNKLNIKYTMDKKQIAWLEKEMKWIWSSKPNEDKEEIEQFIRQIIEKLQFQEQPIYYRVHSTNIMNKRELMKKILALAYLNETQLQKLRNIKTENQDLNKSMNIFFEMINFKVKARDQGWYHRWLWEEYLKMERKINLEIKQPKNINKELIKDLEEIEQEEDKINIINDDKNEIKSDYKRNEIKDVYRTDNKVFSDEECRKEWEREYINAKIASNIYKEAKNIIGNIQSEN